MHSVFAECTHFDFIERIADKFFEDFFKPYWIFELNSTSMSVADFELVTKSFAALPGGVAG